jgi:hypothetical protein
VGDGRTTDVGVAAGLAVELGSCVGLACAPTTWIVAVGKAGSVAKDAGTGDSPTVGRPNTSSSDRSDLKNK